MLTTTLQFLKCPARNASCGGDLAIESETNTAEILFGRVRCKKCKSNFPILAGVAVLVPDVRSYLVQHVKGISRIVSDDQIPAEYRKAFVQAKREIEVEHIEEDLEAERINSLYLMNHYLTSKSHGKWWGAQAFEASPVIAEVIEKNWDHGPFAKIKEQVSALAKNDISLVELGCGVGGLYAALRSNLKTYLGLDSSFASIARARHFALGAELNEKILIPEDLLNGPVSREIKIKPIGDLDGKADFIVCDLEYPPLKEGQWQMSAALNVIDMLEQPESLPALQHSLLQKGGIAIQSCPYIWHQAVAEHLKALIPEDIHNSAEAVEWLYKQVGFSVEKRFNHIPWLFFKHVRQLEIYSVHLFFAAKI